METKIRNRQGFRNLNSMRTVTIIDYGAGNILSIVNAINFLGYAAKITSSPDEIKNSEIVVLPGVGSFYRAMLKLNELGIDEAIKEFAFIKKRKILGICLGMQLMASIGNEEKKIQGLGLIKGEIKNMKLLTNLQLPHIGFNFVENHKDNILYHKLKNYYFYFVHSFFLDIGSGDQDIKLDYCSYGKKFICSFQNQNIFGTQFHPEKSQTNGLNLLKNFLEL